MHALNETIRGASFDLPSGQTAAKTMGLTLLSDAELGLSPGGAAPLWFYPQGSGGSNGRGDPGPGGGSYRWRSFDRAAQGRSDVLLQSGTALVPQSGHRSRGLKHT